MEIKKKKAGFACVNLVKNPESSLCSNRPARISYLKLIYPNGVQLILPSDISRERLSDFINLNPSVDVR